MGLRKIFFIKCIDIFFKILYGILYIFIMGKGNISVIMEQYINPALDPVFKDILEKLHISGIKAAGKIVDHQ